MKNELRVAEDQIMIDAISLEIVKGDRVERVGSVRMIERTDGTRVWFYRKRRVNSIDEICVMLNATISVVERMKYSNERYLFALRD